VKGVFFSIAFIGLVFASPHSLAHHAFAATFRSDAPISVEGEVTRYSFRNPHVLVSFEVTNSDGSRTEWVGEGYSATTLRRQGWSNDTFSVGDIVRISGDSTHDGSPMVAIVTAELIDPTNQSVVVSLAGEQTEATEPEAFVPSDRPQLLGDGRPNLAGLWHGEGSPYASPRDPDVPFNEAGRAFQAAYQPANDPQVFCDQPGLIRQAGMSHYGVRIEQHDDRVVFDYEEYVGHREVFFDDRAALGLHSHFGDAIARYENGALIIETTNLLPNLATPEGNRLSDQATIIQTYKRVDEAGYGAMLSVVTATTDPVYLADTFVMTNIKVAVEDEAFIENECSPPLRERQDVHPYMSFFLTSEGPGDGANLGGLEGADAHCSVLATEVGQSNKTWRAYLSTTGESSVNARDRIGAGPWYNAKGELVATGLNHLHSEQNWLSRATAVDQRGTELSEILSTVQDDGVNSRHDILTGSELDGTASNTEGDTTCSNWTSNSEGSALIGHADRRGGGVNPTSWNYAHPTRGCSPDLLASSDGDGFFYCFAAGE